MQDRDAPDVEGCEKVYACFGSFASFLQSVEKKSAKLQNMSCSDSTNGGHGGLFKIMGTSVF